MPIRFTPTLLLLSCTGPGDTDAMSSMTPCEDETRAIQIEAGTVFEKSALNLTFVSLSPETPYVDENTWVFQVSDTAPISGCSFDASTTMPDHDHDGAIPSFSDTDDNYTGEFDFMMGGYWEIDMLATCGTASERFLIPVCVES